MTVTGGDDEGGSVSTAPFGGLFVFILVFFLFVIVTNRDRLRGDLSNAADWCKRCMGVLP